MNFFLDENIPKPVEKFLSDKGHNLYTTRGTENEGVNDINIFTLAQNIDSILITTDKDFFHTIPFLFENHHGVIVINLRQPNRQKITEKFIWFFNHFDLSQFNNTVVLLRDSTYTIRKQ